MALTLRRDQIRENFSIDQYQVFWEYDNRLVLREREINPTYMFFNRRSKFEYDLILQTRDFSFGREISESLFWDKETNPFVGKGITTHMALNQIESVLVSMAKKGDTKNLKKSDFAFIYWAKGAWHCYYPDIDALISHHKSKEVVNEKYLAFLNSSEVLEKRKEWDSYPTCETPV